MATTAIILLSGLALVQIGCVHGQGSVWQAAQAPGMAFGTTEPPGPTEYQIHMTIANINAAPTEAAAANAAAAIYNPLLDTSDAVKNALERRIQGFRAKTYNPNWVPGMPMPPLPSYFDVNDVIMGAYYGTITAAPPGLGPAPPVAPVVPPVRGPRTSIRRGPAPGRRPGNGNFRRGNRRTRFGNPSAWPPRRNWNAGVGSNPAPAPSDAPPAYTPLASSNPGWIGLNPQAPAQNNMFAW